jgi:hypothetical protein
VEAGISCMHGTRVFGSSVFQRHEMEFQNEIPRKILVSEFKVSNCR